MGSSISRGLVGVLLAISALSTVSAKPTGARHWWDAMKGWRPAAMVTAEARASGVLIGGEGCQWPQSIDIDESDGQFLIFATDVGGVWRSIDGGTTWQHANVGHIPRGSSGIAIDPHFPDRVLSVGSNSGGSRWNGLYLSEDRAASWRPVRLEAISGVEDRRRQIVFDPSTKDDKAGFTRVAYWSRTRETRETWGDLEIDPGLYRSDDGGRSWRRLGESAEIAGHSALAVHPTGGLLYAANEKGVHVSDSGGDWFRRTFEGEATSIAVSQAQPDAVWITTADSIWRSQDRGETWAKLETTGLEEPLRGEYGRDVQAAPRTNVVFGALRVHPLDAKRMVMRSLADDWRWYRHASHDGGQTWKTASTDSSLSFMPRNARQSMFAWHPTNIDEVWSFGGDWPTRSDNGGLSYNWAGDGQNAIYVGGRFSLNPHHPGLLFLSSQDYNGGVTEDGGYTWRYTPVSGFGWGGFVYGGLAISPTVLVGGHAPAGWSGTRTLTISKDGGRTWTETSHQWSHDRAASHHGSNVGIVHPIDPDVAFLARFRTHDGGETWASMQGCNGVYASDAQGNLYGTYQRSEDADIVLSADDGITWQVLAKARGVVDDLAVTPDGENVYFAMNGRLWAFGNDEGPEPRLMATPKTTTNRHRVATVALDPRDGKRLFVGQRIDQHAADVGVLMSDDGGQTWTNLTRTEPLRDGELDGGREPECIRVDPHSGILWVTTGCYGVWQYVFEE